MLKIGLEKEFFVQDKFGNIAIVPDGVSHDDCGWLAEARGKPSSDITEAVFSLMADIHRLRESLADNLHSFLDGDVVKIPRELRIKAQRKYAKGKIHYENLYGYKYHRNTLAECVAGLHISFTNEKMYIGKDGKHHTYNALFDYVKLFKRIDDVYLSIIKEAKRRPGFYEIKPDGRIEYRSLPASTDLISLINNLQIFVKGVL